MQSCKADNIMSKEMLEAFRILEEEKHINKSDIIDAVTESLKSAYKRRYGNQNHVSLNLMKKQLIFKSSPSVKLLKKFLTAAWKLV